MVSKKVQTVRASTRNLTSKTMLLSHRMRAAGFYCEAGIEWDIVDVPQRHDNAMVIRPPRPATSDEVFKMQGAETVCDAQLRVKDRPAFQLILETGLSYRIMSAEGKGDDRIYKMILSHPQGAIKGEMEESDEEWCKDVLRLHDKLFELEQFRTLSEAAASEAGEKSETDEAGEKSGESGTSERELADRLRKALH